MGAQGGGSTGDAAVAGIFCRGMVVVRGQEEMQESSFVAQSQFSELSQRLQKLEKPIKAYSPSAVAASWHPPHSFQPNAPPGAYDRAPIDNDIPTWFYGDAQMGNALDPDWLEPYLQTLYFKHLSVPSSHVPTDMQRDYMLCCVYLLSFMW